MEALKPCSNWLMRETDSESDIKIKRILTPVIIVMSIACIVDVARACLFGEQYYATVVSFTLPAWTLYLIGAYVGLNIGMIIDFCMILIVIIILAVDLLHAATLQLARVSIVVIILDVSLAFNRNHVPLIAIPLTIVYLFAINIESHFRLGLYDLPGEEPEVCGCVDPPCSLPFLKSFGSFCWISSVLVIDFYLTRQFAHDLRRQLQSVRTSVEVAGEVAAALARYDVDVAEEAINGAKDLPEELGESFLQLLSNLRSYRDYLPEALLLRSTDDEELQLAIAPGEGGGTVDVAMVFTDIQSSTALWEAYPAEMYEALQMHNAALRAVAKMHR
eukprot:Hpha_TRINITY_DN15529_c6_g5::TRINITY_DN15529_c6_g5_i1::g.105996::m.105996